MKPTVITSQDNDSFDFGGLGVHWKINGPATQGRFAVVHHSIAPHALAAPLHLHHNENEYSYVLKGTLGGLLGDEVVRAEAGTWVFKPRGQWHPFWNPGDEPCEIISSGRATAGDSPATEARKRLRTEEGAHLIHGERCLTGHSPLFDSCP